MKKLKTKKVYIAIFLISFIILCSIFPVQKQVSIYALNRYLVAKNISSKDIYDYVILKEYKSTLGGYQIFVKFMQEMDLVYVYRYSFRSNKLFLDAVYKNESTNELTGGVNIECFSQENGIRIPKFEPQYYSNLSSMQYTFIDYLQDMFSKMPLAPALPLACGD